MCENIDITSWSNYKVGPKTTRTLAISFHEIDKTSGRLDFILFQGHGPWCGIKDVHIKHEVHARAASNHEGGEKEKMKEDKRDKEKS